MTVRKEILIILVVFLMLSCRNNQTSNVLTLNLTNDWEFKQTDSSLWRSAAVPGCVHTDMMTHNIIPDPFIGTNEHEVQWAEEKDWEYRTSFNLPEKILKKDFIELHFNGLDTYADVYLNDSLILKANNMFVSFNINCKHLLKQSNNTLYIHFKSPVKKERKLWDKYPYELPGGQKVMTRKAGFHYGWDWGARLVTSGIWKPIKIVAWDQCKIYDLQITNDVILENEAVLKITVAYSSDKDLEGEMIINVNDTLQFTETLKLNQGEHTIYKKINISDPELWWPSGMGEPYLYRIEVKLQTGHTLLDKRELSYGIRTAELVNKPDSLGESFFFKINGEPVFMKGANYIPQDNFQNRLTKERYDQLFETVTKSNMNMLRVWGGGIYEDDYFYELCDKNGILVWQDFMFACAMYPGTDEFLKNVEKELVQNVKRLRNHPSVALWCGNNEIDEAWHNWGWSNAFSEEDSAAVWEGYKKLFHELIPNVLHAHDPDRAYVSSSPRYGRGNSKSLFEGDSHYWGVWHDSEPFEMFEEKVPRFMSEFGFQSFPDKQTILKFAKENELSTESEVMLSHQKHPRGNQLIRQYLDYYYFVPEKFEHFLYLSQLLQAEGMRTGIEAQRRAWPYCGGSLYWQLNDCWPVISWSGIDYYGRLKALQYFVKHAFKDVILSVYDHDNLIDVYVVSDKSYDISGILNMRVTDFYGNEKWSDNKEITANARKSGIYSSIPEQIYKQYKDNKHVLICEFIENGQIIDKSFHYLVKKRLPELPGQQLKINFNKADDGSRIITISSDVLIKNLYIYSNCEGFFSDNYFDTEAGEIKEIRFIPEDPQMCERIKFKFMSLNKLMN